MQEELNISESFKRFRSEFNLSKADVAGALGIAVISYDYEKQGKSSNPTSKTLFKLAKAYNVSVDYLLGLTDDPRTAEQILEETKISRLHGKKITDLKAEVARLTNQLNAIRDILNSSK